ncbi:hypothetical protein PR048_031397 [Dryococelus australis]|uniref:Uncharacterized protein n=1 Tax=Dryococelus australis TaxID=614101 RepID=A0ABQ9G554_9NEOP|nr:hypothetical protein PR048_031397 [Dryococelus australis]
MQRTGPSGHGNKPRHGVSEDICVALNNEVLRADEGEVSAGMQGRRKMEIPEETHRQAASSGTIPLVRRIRGSISHKYYSQKFHLLRLLGRKIMQGDMHCRKERLGSHGLHFGAMTTSLSVLRASLNYEEQGKNRQERRKNPCDREPMRVIGASMERRRNEGVGEVGDPREDPPTNGIVRHDSHMRRFGVTRPGIEPGSPWWEASRLTAQPPRVIDGKTARQFSDFARRGDERVDAHVSVAPSAPPLLGLSDVQKILSTRRSPQDARTESVSLTTTPRQITLGEINAASFARNSCSRSLGKTHDLRGGRKQAISSAARGNETFKHAARTGKAWVQLTNYHTPKPGEVERSSVVFMQHEDWRSTNMVDALEKPLSRSAQGQLLQSSLHPHPYLHPSLERRVLGLLTPLPSIANFTSTRSSLQGARLPARELQGSQWHGLQERHRLYAQDSELACSVLVVLHVLMALQRRPYHFTDEKSVAKFNTDS